MSERLINSPCSIEERQVEIAALPAELRDFLERRMRVETGASGEDVQFPAYRFSLTLGTRACDVAIDIALLRRVYADGGLAAAISFICNEMKAFLEGLSQATQEDIAA